MKSILPTPRPDEEEAQPKEAGEAQPKEAGEGGSQAAFAGSL